MFRATKTILLIFFIWFLTAALAIAQNQANHWCFGYYAHLDFSGGAPVNATNSAIYTYEGCATMSSASGNLLLYSDGINVYNANHAVMPNGFGLLGNSSSTQSAIIVQRPGNPNQYYVITVWTTTGTGLRYSLVDMTLNGGLGDVLVGQKNILITNDVAEKVTAMRHGNGVDFWIVTKKKVGNYEYNSFLLTAAGINTTPVVSPSAGNLVIGGYLKGNAQGTKIGNAGSQNFELYDFNNWTGALTNQILIPGYCYGFEFSPDGTKLYTSNQIKQYNLTLANTTAIVSSGISLSTSFNFYAMQLAPNGVIYIINTGNQTALAGILNPNLLGTAANFVPVAHTLPTGVLARWGLPTFVTTIFNVPEITYSDTCFSDTTILTIIDTSAVTAVSWNFGDPNSGTLNTSNSIVASHVYSSPGNYTVQAIVTRGAQIDTVYENLNIEFLPNIQLSNDTSICEGDTVGVFVNSSNLSFLWSTGSTDSTIHIVQTGTYWAQVSNACGMDIDTVEVDTVFPAIVHFGADTLLCDGDSVLLDATIMNGTYQWSTGSTDSTYMVYSQNVYLVTATNFCGVDYDTIFVDYLTPPSFDFGPDTVLCQGQSVLLSIQDTLGVYQWDNGSTNFFRTLNQQGLYWGETSNQCGVYRDSIQIYTVLPPTAFIGNDTVLCFGDTLQLFDTDVFTTYLWQDGSNDSVFTVQAAGDYWLQKTNACGSIADTIHVEYDTIPIVDLGPDTAFCISNPYWLDGTFSRGSYVWQDGSTNATFLATATGTYWVETTNLCGVASDTVFINFHEPITFELGNDTAICYYDSLLLNIASNNATYSWNTGETDSTIWIYGGNYYEGTASNLCGNYTDNINVLRIDIPVGTFPQSAELCEDQTFEAIVTSFNSDGIVWNDGSTDFTRTLSTSGQYSATLYNVCASKTDSFSLDFQAYPTVDLGLDTVICYGDEIEFTVDSLDRYSITWNTGNTEKTERIYFPQTVGVVVSTSAGCTTTDEVWVDDCGGRLYIPTAFSPDGNGLNDKFEIIGEHITFFELHIFNAWGEEVFVSEDINYSWNGRYNGKKAIVGTYTYRLSYLDPNTQTLKKVTGRFTLL